MDLVVPCPGVWDLVLKDQNMTVLPPTISLIIMVEKHQAVVGLPVVKEVE